ncbi:MAG: FliG C-terminal domain-containing protein [Sedimentisphaerales bacterium]|jgi:flagellar motor switch protein FliG|nr:FliG C-terminal domain-containing protein [Sedimentisphaerales bacterium]
MISETLTGRQKAAMLLMGLDRSAAAELLKGLDPELLRMLAVEISYMDAIGLKDNTKIDQVAREFYNAVSEGANGLDAQVRVFLDQTLKDLVGPEKAKQIKASLGDLLLERDPFLPIRRASVDVLAAVLEKEHPQAVAVVLSELSPRQSAAVLGRLNSGLRVSAVARMTSVDAMSAQAKRRIGQMIAAKIEQQGVQAGQIQQQGPSSTRKVAIVVRTVEKEIRDQIIGAIRKKDQATADAIEETMILWEDLPLITDRSLQNVLRGIEERTLALALYDSPEQIANKIKSNISERAAAMVQEETSLMSKPRAKDVEQAREKVLHRLRELLKNGDLAFEEGNG